MDRLRRGVIRYYDGTFTTHTIANGLPSHLILRLYADPATKSLRVITDKGVVEWQGGRFVPATFYDIPIRYSGTPPFAFDNTGALWLNDGAVLRRFTRDGVSTFKHKSALTGWGVSAAHQDRQGNSWIGTWRQFRESAGLYRLKDGEVSVYAATEGLPKAAVNQILEGRQGNLWFATHGGGLVQYKDGKFHTYTTSDGLAGNSIWKIIEDREGTLWIGTYDGGLSRLKDGKFTAYAVKDGLFDQGVFQILEDERGHFWMSCNRGIYRVSRQELNEFAEGKRSRITSVSYGKRDGTLDAECNGGTQPAGFKSRDGKLWFPTQKGIVVIDPAALPRDVPPPPVAIEECLLDREVVDYRHGVEILPGSEGLEIHYTGLSFIKPEQVRFKYRLVGLDEDWVDAGTRRNVFYGHLPPGEYTFKVIAANTDGVWSGEGAALRIVVRPPFWRTWWFLSLGLGGCLATLALAHKLRVRHLKRERARQETFFKQLIDSQERERQRIAAELHDSLGQDLLIIKNWALLGLNLPANDEGDVRARQQLSEISETASQAIEEVREIAYALRPYQLDELGLTKAIESILARVSQSSAIRFEWEIDLLDGAFSKDQEINFYRIVQECINNIVKHARATLAHVSIKRSEHDVRLVIRDNGIGFDHDALGANGDGRRGFGLTGITERARMLGGKLTVQSAPGTGTTVSLTLDSEDKR